MSNNGGSGAKEQRPTGVEATRRRQKLSKKMLETVAAFRLVEQGDRILVAVSGGKDSYTLLDLLEAARRKAPVRFELVGFHLDQGQPGYDGEPLRAWLERFGVPFQIGREDTYSAVMAEAGDDDDATYCRLCSRLRRGILYTAAGRLGCNKVALGHHRDDGLETLLLNLFFAGRLQAMPARFTTNDGRFEVIRPLIECGEAEIARHAVDACYPILPCRLCGSQRNLKRERVADLLSSLEREIPNLRQVMLAALKNVRPSHLLDPEVAQAWLSQASSYTRRR
jgi:tRNA 2-thiocytidine biosynthesis protein TtcA